MLEKEHTSAVTNDLSPELDDISIRLVEARASASPLANFPGALPRTLEQAYAVQSASIARWPDAVAGWKVGGIPPALRESAGAGRLAGPIFESAVVSASAGSTVSMPVYSGGFAAIEAEFVLKLGESVDPSSRDFSESDLVSLVADLHVGAEIASSPMADVNKLGPCSIASDFGNNAGLVVGPSVDDWTDIAPESMTVGVRIDDSTVGEADASVVEGGLLQSLRFLIEISAARGLSLPAGTLVSCGAVTGIHEVTAGSTAEIDFGALGAFTVDFTPMQSRL